MLLLFLGIGFLILVAIIETILGVINNLVGRTTILSCLVELIIVVLALIFVVIIMFS